MINTLEELLQDYASYSLVEGVIDENTSMHLIENAQNYIKELTKENLLSICGVGKQLNDLKEVNSIIEQLPKFKVLYNGQVSYDGINYMSIDELINKLKAE